MALKDVTFTPRDYLLPVSFSRHATQPPSPVSRRDAGSCLPTRRIASTTSSAGMISPTPESAGFAVHGVEARSIHALRLPSPRLVQPARRAAALAGFAQGRGKLPPHAAHRVDHLVRGHDQPHARKSAAFTLSDYFLPVSFSRHAAQPPSPVSRRDAGSCRPTRRMASITSSAGMISPTPEIARFAAHGAEARSIHAQRLLSPRLVQPTRRAAAFAGLAQRRGKLPSHAAHRVDHLVRGHDQPHARKSAAFTLSDYFLPVSFSRHAAQPPSPVSRRDAGSCLPTRRIASITSSAGMISPTPEVAGVRGAWR